MNYFNIERLNNKKIELGESPIILPSNAYSKPINNGEHLIDNGGNEVGTKGDMYSKIIIDKILRDGCLDNDPRPVYVDFYEGSKYFEKENLIILPNEEVIKIDKNAKVTEKENGIEVKSKAHTISVNQGIECTYDLTKGETPLSSLRPTAYKWSIAEIIWIYVLESNDLVEFDELLGISTWDENHEINNWWKAWAIKDKNGNYILNEKGHPTIGATYGETIRRRHMLKKEVIEQIRNNPDGRRNICSLWQVDDFNEMHGLKPCAFQTIWNVRRGWDGVDYLDMTLIQRSSDFATAGVINQFQYIVLQKMVAKELGYTPGYFTWKPINVQLYDRHIANAIEMINREPITFESTIITDYDKDFYDIRPKDISVKGYPRELVKKKNPQLSFELGE